MAGPLAAAGAGGGIGTATKVVALDRLIDLIPQLFRDQAPRSGGVGNQGYASPQLDINQLFTAINQENFNRARLRSIGIDAGPPIDFKDVSRFFSEQSAQRMAEAGVRERALANIQGQYGAMPSMYQAVGTGLQAMGGNIDTAIDKILGRRTIGGEASATEVARGF